MTRLLDGVYMQELRTTMHELGDLLQEQEIEQFMSLMDVNNDGVIGVSPCCEQDRDACGPC